jgi:membrane protease YdiL (CAAX protease family)
MTAEPQFASPDNRESHEGAPPIFAERAVALLEVLLCSDYPTQLALTAILLRLGIPLQRPDGGLSLQFVATLSLIDAALLVALILLFLRAHGEEPRTVLIGVRPIGRELRVGVGLIVAAFVIAGIVLGALLRFAPQLHTVTNNPLTDLMRTPGETALFAVVVVVAGGIREEIQRAFLMHRFERWLGGSAIGVVATSIVFGIGHLAQGLDAAITTASLGAFWAVVYLRRRSAVAPIVSHSGFNLLQLVQFLATGR